MGSTATIAFVALVIGAVGALVKGELVAAAGCVALGIATYDGFSKIRSTTSIARGSRPGRSASTIQDR
jgi:hypothetical protein